MPTVTTLSGRVIAVDLGTRDFEGYRASVLEDGGLADTYVPNWTDRSELDVGVALVEAFAFMADNISYYQDRCANEALFPSVVQRRSVIEHCKLIGYELSPNTSATTDLTIVCNSSGIAYPGVGYSSIPAGTQVNVDTSDGSENITFEFKEEFLYTGAGTFSAEIVHGETVTDPPFSSSDGPDQKFVLAQAPMTVAVGETSSLQVWVTESITELWTQVDNFLESEAIDKVYRIEISEYDIITVIFGDGVNGKIPNSGSDNISVTYRIGGGTAGNEVSENKLTELSGTFDFVDSITNAAKPNGGAEKESIAQAKINAPLSLKALGRAVTHEDYAAIAVQYGGASKAYAFQGDGAYEEHVVVSVGGLNPVPTGTWDPYAGTGTLQLGVIGAEVAARKTTPVILFMDPARAVDMWLHITAYLFDGVRHANVTRAVYDTLLYAFHPDNQQLKGFIPISRIDDICEGISGIDYIDIVRCQRQPLVRHKTGDSDMAFSGYVCSQLTTRDRWAIRFTSATTFSVRGENAGLQAASGTVGVLYTTDNSEFSFLTTAGSSAPAGDIYEIVTGPYAGNLYADSDEVIRLQEAYLQLGLSGGVA